MNVQTRRLLSVRKRSLRPLISSLLRITARAPFLITDLLLHNNLVITLVMIEFLIFYR